MAVGLIIFNFLLATWWKLLLNLPSFPLGLSSCLWLAAYCACLCRALVLRQVCCTVFKMWLENTDPLLVGFFLGSYPAVLVSDFSILKDLFKVFCTKMSQSKNANGASIWLILAWKLLRRLKLKMWCVAEKKIDYRTIGTSTSYILISAFMRMQVTEAKLNYWPFVQKWFLAWKFKSYRKPAYSCENRNDKVVFCQKVTFHRNV